MSDILKYMLGEFCIDSAPEYANDERTCEKWEVDWVKQVSDTNLGDFVVKCPNPDNLPPDWIDRYEVTEEKGELSSPAPVHQDRTGDVVFLRPVRGGDLQSSLIRKREHRLYDCLLLPQVQEQLRRDFR